MSDVVMETSEPLEDFPELGKIHFGKVQDDFNDTSVAAGETHAGETTENTEAFSGAVDEKEDGELTESIETSSQRSETKDLSEGKAADLERPGYSQDQQVRQHNRRPGSLKRTRYRRRKQPSVLQYGTNKQTGVPPTQRAGFPKNQPGHQNQQRLNRNYKPKGQNKNKYFFKKGGRKQEEEMIKKLRLEVNELEGENEQLESKLKYAEDSVEILSKSILEETSKERKKREKREKGKAPIRKAFAKLSSIRILVDDMQQTLLDQLMDSENEDEGLGQVDEIHLFKMKKMAMDLQGTFMELESSRAQGNTKSARGIVKVESHFVPIAELNCD